MLLTNSESADLKIIYDIKEQPLISHVPLHVTDFNYGVIAAFKIHLTQACNPPISSDKSPLPGWMIRQPRLCLYACQSR